LAAVGLTIQLQHGLALLLALLLALGRRDAEKNDRNDENEFHRALLR
jgi:hypothetical protein